MTSSALLPAGSTRRWRTIRRAILDRDGHVCQWPLAEGGVCGAPANTAGHIIRRKDGGTDDPSNLRAECSTHNFADGARARNEQRQTTPHHRAKGW